MISAELIEKQLKRIGFNTRGWGRTEVHELKNIIMPDEEIFECVNGFYEGGFAMLLATDVRVLLVDKKPLNYLTVEDLRFDMISEIDYNHRLLGAYIAISTGSKNLKFTTINQPRLRKLIGHVQSCMAEVKKKQSTHQEGQHQHLEQINQQLRSYLVAQYKQQQELSKQLQRVRVRQESAASLPVKLEPIRPSPELSDYLLAQSLLAQHQEQTGQTVEDAAQPQPADYLNGQGQLDEIYAAGRQEVFGKNSRQPAKHQHLKRLAARTLTSAAMDQA